MPEPKASISGFTGNTTAHITFGHLLPVDAIAMDTKAGLRNTQRVLLSRRQFQPF